MANVFSRIFQRIGIRRMTHIVVGAGIDSDVLLPYECEELFLKNHTVRAMHTLLAGGFGRLSWKVYDAQGIEQREFSKIADAYMGQLAADWLVIGLARWREPFVRVAPRGLLEWHYELFNDSYPLQAGKSLKLKLEELERAERQAYWKQGAKAMVAVRSASSGLIPTPKELEDAQKQIDAIQRTVGAGGLAMVPVPLEPVTLDGTSLKDYDFPAQRVMLIRELCNLFRVDSALMNDPANKTYSNKTEAEKSLYVNVIIPEAYRFALDVNRLIKERASPAQRYFIMPDPSGLEPLAEERRKMAEGLLNLVAAGVLTAAEVRQMLLEAGIVKLPKQSE